MKAFSLLVLAALLMGAGVPPESPPPYPPGYRPQADGSFTLRPDLAFAIPFVQVLREAGIPLVRVEHSKYNGLFPEVHQAAFVETSLGVVEALFFPASPGVRLTIHHDSEPIGGEPGATEISLDGANPTTIYSPTGLDVWLTGRVLVLTRSRPLAAVLHPALDGRFPDLVPSLAP